MSPDDCVVVFSVIIIAAAVVFVAMAIPREEKKFKISNPKRYLIAPFQSTQDLEDWINSSGCEGYEAISISDTNAYITVLMKRKGPQQR